MSDKKPAVEIFKHPKITDLAITVEATDLGNRVIAHYKQEPVMKWYDQFVSDFPEKVTWDNMIADIFNMGIALGLEHQKNEKRIITEF